MKIRKEIMRKKTSAFVLNFTLIELLVVIAIIAVLAGILLPALNSARDKGISISCMNTIRTLGFAAVQYAGTYNEYWVPYNRGGDANYAKWYNGNREFASLHGLPVGSVEMRFVKTASVCRAATLLRATDARYPSPAWICMENVYANGLHLDVENGPFSDTWEYRFVRLNKVKQPSSRFGFLETNNEGRTNSNYKWADWIVDRNAVKTVPAYRHNGGRAMNIAFFDGHAELRDYTRVDYASTSDPNYNLWRPYKY